VSLCVFLGPKVNAAEMERLLRKGAYALLDDDEEEWVTDDEDDGEGGEDGGEGGEDMPPPKKKTKRKKKSEGQSFCEEDIDQILSNRSRKVENEKRDKTESWLSKRKSTSGSGGGESIKIRDPYNSGGGVCGLSHFCFGAFVRATILIIRVSQ